MEKRERFTAARALVDQDWGQGDRLFTMPKTCHCVATALISVNGGFDTQARADVELYRITNTIMDTSIGSWNDAPERTKGEVLAGFDKVIESLGCG